MPILISRPSQAFNSATVRGLVQSWFLLPASTWLSPPNLLVSLTIFSRKSMLKKCWIKSMADASPVTYFCRPVSSSHAGGRFISTTGSCHWNENVRILVQFVEIVLPSLTSLAWTWLSSQSKIFPLEFFHILVYLCSSVLWDTIFSFPFPQENVVIPFWIDWLWKRASIWGSQSGGRFSDMLTDIFPSRNLGFVHI